MKKLFLLSVCLVTAAKGASLLWSYDDQKCSRKVLLVKDDEFRKGSLIRMSEELLEKNRSLVFLQVVFLVQSKDVSYLSLGRPVKPLPMGFVTWRDAYSALARADIRAAELVAVNDSAVLRLRQDDRIETIVLRRSNPLNVAVEGGQIEIIMFRFEGTAKIESVEVYCRTRQGLSSQFGKQVLSQLRRMLPFPRITLLVRNDDLFAGEWHFPWIHLFHLSSRPPTEAEYRTTSTLYCVKEREAEGVCAEHTFEMAAGGPH